MALFIFGKKLGIRDLPVLFASTAKKDPDSLLGWRFSRRFLISHLLGSIRVVNTNQVTGN